MKIEYDINLDDLDYAGIVGNASWLIILQRARIKFLELLGSSMKELAAIDIGGVVSEANLKYLRPAKHRDRILIEIMPSDLTKTSVLLNYVARASDGESLLDASLKMVFVSNSEGRPKRIPGILRSKLEELINGKTHT